jgi:enoyl-CoA hydratase
MAFENLIVIDRGSTRIITVNRPDVMNALSKGTLLELERALIDIEANAAIRAVILTGAGEKSFIAGADVGELSELTPKEAQQYSALGHRVFDRIGTLRVPVIAAVNGFALGGGLECALACDFIYASDTAQLGLVEVNLGLIPGFGGIARLSRRVGQAMASEMLFAARKLKAEEALRIGLVNRVVPGADLVDTAVKTAEAIGEKGPIAVQAVKRLLTEGEGADPRTANLLEQNTFGLVFSTEDHDEGIKAFLEKRKASFKGL